MGRKGFETNDENMLITQLTEGKQALPECTRPKIK